jgi:hypothetical protein
MRRHFLPILLAASAFFAAAPASAQMFSAQVMPPRFEDAARPGTTYRNVIEIHNSSRAPVSFRVRTADWELTPDGNAEFAYELAPGSCRPWVGLEAGQVQIAANGRRRFRFEVAVPADATPGQCRFAIMIEGEPQANESGVAVAGRIGIVVYLDVGGAAARLEVIGAQVGKVEGNDLPMLQVRNLGNAHGRLEGLLTTVDAAGRRWNLAPASDPILPGATRMIPLIPAGEPEGSPERPTLPLRLDGRLDWRNQRIPVDVTVSR